MMLTKEHLNFRVRSGRLYPALLEAENASALRATIRANELAGKFEGETLQNLLDEVENEDKAVQAMVHLIVNQSDIDAVEDVAEMRWQWLIAAEEIRQEGGYATLAEFNREFLQRVERSHDTAKELLYSDLPETTKIRSVRRFSSEELIGVYNLAQIKGLLLRARNVTLIFDQLTVTESRFVFRMLKFHQLVASVARKKQQLMVEITGSLEMFGVTQASFGRNVAKFLGYLPKLSQWQLKAEIRIKNANLQLNVDHKAFLFSDHQFNLQYVPPEIATFLDQMSKHLPEWQVFSGAEVVNLGGQVYCIPDVTLVSPAAEVSYIELFHKYHQGQLKGRLEQWLVQPNRQLVLGLSTKVTQDADTSTLLAKAQNLGLRTFEFRDFPTAKAALPAIAATSSSDRTFPPGP